MVKRDLVGRVSSTMAVSVLIIRQIMQAGCGAMLRVVGYLTACNIRPDGAIEDDDTLHLIRRIDCRIYRSTVLQIRSMIGA